MRTNLKDWLKRLKDEGTRHLAKLVLGSTKPADVEDVPDLVEALKSRDSERRLWASVALAGIGPKAEAAIPALTDLLHHDPAFGNRQAAAYALARIGVGLHLTVPALAQAMEDGNPVVRQEIARSLGKIGTPDAVAALIRACGDHDPDVRRNAAIAVKMLGPAAVEAIPALRQLLSSEKDEDIRSQAETALRFMGDH